jgi:hypothetical protein
MELPACAPDQKQGHAIDLIVMTAAGKGRDLAQEFMQELGVPR